jgi:hypothetical protein
LNVVQNPVRSERQPAPSYASLADMEAWARSIMLSRQPDYVIGEDYLRRWWITPRNAFCNVYLHEILRSDIDRALHDHPWGNSSYLIAGRYVEHTPSGRFLRVAGDFVERSAMSLHRLEVLPGETVISLFMTGPKVREWGFECPNGWVHWQDFTDPNESTRVGRGCGED